MAIIHQGNCVWRERPGPAETGGSAVLIKTGPSGRGTAVSQGRTKPIRSAVIHSDGILVELDLENIPELNRQVVGAGFGVSALVPRRTLENYFLNLIEGRET